MNGKRLPKPIRKKLRELSGVAYERELGRELDKLMADFGEWKKGNINAFELSDRVHKYHNGPQKDIYKFYTDPEENVCVARAAATGVLKRDEVPDEILAAIERQVEYFANVRSDG